MSKVAKLVFAVELTLQDRPVRQRFQSFVKRFRQQFFAAHSSNLAFHQTNRREQLRSYDGSMSQLLPRLRMNLDFMPSPVENKPGLLIRDSLDIRTQC